MAYDENLASRVRDLLGGRSGVTEVRMFGGPAGCRIVQGAAGDQ
ncbi:hypothetical protein [Micromonospora sp. CPCC 206061]